MEPSELDDWAATASRTVGVTIEHGDVAAILDLSRDAAHGIARPAAPLTAYLAGIAVGRGLPLAEVTAALTAAIASWTGVTDSGAAATDRGAE
ncbi:DUF6457 domain-containing protein [Leifsonia sp. F6_8S_P_1B]|uniref:DUF6457 domain-containing protein n=1 Tax=Leifsonia williamsii TaxID=3035919 RepID=A0ABT8K731_9MICO|nr:DUF6457 domain-containing protein [Leifsonia williamsii]MDN4613265.1 DUF6457 domain-containing protein [Leifsonia williamsii]